MKLRHPLAIRCAAFGIATVLRGWIASLRFRWSFLCGRQHPLPWRSRRCIYAVWHDSFLMMARKRSRLQMLISQHADGELAAKVASHLGCSAIRGSTTRGGATALLDMARSTEGHLFITPDGPRGPRHIVQPGIAKIASITGLPVYLVAFSYSRAWRAKSWDRFAIPWPGSTVFCVISEPLIVPPDLNRDGVRHWRDIVQQHFDNVTNASDSWAAGGPKPIKLPPPSQRRAA
jgi:lysophospholipid acyltransferase (LPLAT)-like uncharacterized protein